MSLGAAVLTVVAGLLGLAQYLNFKSKRQRQVEAGEAFTRVIAALGSNSEVERLTSAALVRRFFDRGSEYGRDAQAYAGDAVKVVAGVLRTEPTGPVQKLLADGLASAPSLRGVDLQRANLQDCYWGSRSPNQGVNLSGADLFSADLSRASLRNAVLRGTTFREANLGGSVLIGSDCRDADFSFANLRGAKFDGAVATGACFAGASNIPDPVLRLLDADAYVQGGPIGAEDHQPSLQPPRGVFISAPSKVDELDLVALEQIVRGVQDAGCEVVRYLPEDYSIADPLGGIAKTMSTCRAAIIFGPPRFQTGLSESPHNPAEAPVSPSVQATPWNQVEAGMAVGLGLPVLIARRKVRGGVFDLSTTSSFFSVVSLEQSGELSRLSGKVARWCAAVTTESV